MDLFGEEPLPALRPARLGRKAPPVQAAEHASHLHLLAATLPPELHMGTSSWSFPGWKGLVWADDYSDSTLSREGLKAYGAHPLLTSVSLDRSFYRPLTASEYAVYAAQVPEQFRFIVKAPSLVCDAVMRTSDGRGLQDNPAFLDPELAAREFVQPALEGLGTRIGALVFQLSPLPASWLSRMDEVQVKLGVMLASLPKLDCLAPEAVIAVEVRNPEFVTPGFASVLKAAGVTYCLGLHPKMPPIEQQLPMLRALWPGPLVCRWSLNQKHGAYGYQEAKGLYEPFDRLVNPDPALRAALARVVAATANCGLAVYIAINNKAEGSAPLSVLALAQEVASLMLEKPSVD